VGVRLGEALRRMYAHAGPEIEAVGVSGSADEVVAGLREVADAGAELILLNPMFDDADQLERLAAEVIPQLKN
jgi:alkanesulfonate monooxygenase SsuD/methylene tetrahydromethanopterin reductase-like flavin-dependent oxidoreductase (luciferase family)